jgi:hypothetical protein
MCGGEVGAGPTPAIADQADGSSLDRGSLGEEVDRDLQVAHDLAVRHAAHEVLEIRDRDVLGRGSAAVEVHGQSGIAHFDELVDHTDDVIAIASGIVDHDDTRLGPSLGCPVFRSNPISTRLELDLHSTPSCRRSTCGDEEPVKRTIPIAGCH